MDHNQFLFESVIGFPTQLLVDNQDVNQGGSVLLSPANQSQISNQNMVEMGKKLLEAASENNVDAVRSLMSGGAPFTGNWLGTTPLHAAAKAGHVETVELLLKAGIFRDAKTKVERTALQMAAEEGHSKIVEMLIQYGADVNARDMLKMTALHWAVERGHQDSVRILLSHGADVSAVNKFDKTPLEIACDNGVEDIIRLLEDMPSSFDSAGALTAISETAGAAKRLENELRREMPKEEWKNSPEEDALEKLTSNASNSSSQEAVKLLESHGISFLPTDNSTVLTSALESGQNICLTEAGKMALKQLQTITASPVKSNLQPPVAKKPKVFPSQSTSTGLPRVVTITAEQLLALASKLQTKGNNKPVIITLPKNVEVPVQGRLPVANRCAKPTIAPAIVKKPVQPVLSTLSEFLASKSIANLQKTDPKPIKQTPLLSMPNLSDDSFTTPTENGTSSLDQSSETIVPYPMEVPLEFDQFVHTSPNEETVETSIETSGSIHIYSQPKEAVLSSSLKTLTAEDEKKIYFLKSGLLKGSARTTPMTLLWKRKRKRSSLDEDSLDTAVTASVEMTPVESHCQLDLHHQPTLNNAAPLDADDGMFINDESGSGSGHNPPVWLSIMEDNQYSPDNDDDLLDPTKLAAQLASIRQAASQYSFSN